MLELIKRKLVRGGPSVVGSCAFTGKIFVIGLSGTGTRSLHMAFRMLGIHSRHYPRAMEEFEEFQALSDIPVTCRYRYLDKLFPNSKFIFTTREVESWLGNRKRKPADKKLASFWIKLNRLMTYECLEYDEAKLRAAHERWHSEIRDYFKGREDFLEMNIIKGDGWEKLCPFIDATNVGALEFPRVKKIRK